MLYHFVKRLTIHHSPTHGNLKFILVLFIFTLQIIVVSDFSRGSQAFHLSGNAFCLFGINLDPDDIAAVFAE